MEGPGSRRPCSGSHLRVCPCRTVERVVTSAFAGVCARHPALNPSPGNVSEPQFPCGDSLCLLLTVCEKGECLSSVKFILYTAVR